MTPARRETHSAKKFQSGSTDVAQQLDSIRENQKNFAERNSKNGKYEGGTADHEEEETSGKHAEAERPAGDKKLGKQLLTKNQVFGSQGANGERSQRGRGRGS